MTRIRADYVLGTTDTALTATDTALSSPGLANLPAVTGSDVAAVTLYDGTNYEIVHVTGHTAAATTATILRAQEGSTAQAWDSGTTWHLGLTVADTVEFASGGGGGGGGLIASHSYNPTTATGITLTATEADLDATNLAVTFTAPASGAVIVMCSLVAAVTPPSATGSTVVNLSFRNGASTVTGSQGRIFLVAADDKPIQARVLHEAKVAGLTPGASYTYKLGGWNGGTGSGTVQVGGTGTNPVGPATFKVLSA